MDGALIGTTINDTLIPADPLTAGKHTWQVEAVDRAGQTNRSRARTLKIDSIAPTLKVTLTRQAGGGEVVEDRGEGDRHRRRGARSRDRGLRRSLGHDAFQVACATSYKRGSFTLKVAAVDKAGNIGRKTVKLRIKKS